MKKLTNITSFAVFEPTEKGGYDVSFPAFPGCVTFGRTFEEAQKMAKEVLSLWLEEMADQHKFTARKKTFPIVGPIEVSVHA